MPALKLNLSQTLLFMVLLYASPSGTLPVKQTLGKNCVLDAEKMLEKIEKASTHEDLYRGINMDLSAELNFTTQTPTVCRPTESRSTCSGETQLEYDEELCLASIGEDLVYFRRFLSAGSHPSYLSTDVLERVLQVMASCVPETLSSELPEKTTAVSSQSYEDRLTLAKVLKGFLCRAVTINRALSHIQATRQQSAL